jgi:hypothetical protein
VAQVAGPAAGGLLVQALTAPYAILLDAVSFLWSAVWVASIRSREPKPERAADRNLVREVREGLSFVFGHRLLRAIAACTATSNLFSNVAMTAFVVLLASPDQLDLAAGTIGLLFSAGAVGGLLGGAGGAAVRRLGRAGAARGCRSACRRRRWRPRPFVDRGWQLWLVGASFVVSGMTVVVYNITQVSFRQLLCPERLLGRMNATIRFAVWGTIPIGALIGGTLGSTIGLRPRCGWRSWGR